MLPDTHRTLYRRAAVPASPAGKVVPVPGSRSLAPPAGTHFRHGTPDMGHERPALHESLGISGERRARECRESAPRRTDFRVASENRHALLARARATTTGDGCRGVSASVGTTVSRRDHDRRRPVALRLDRAVGENQRCNLGAGRAGPGRRRGQPTSDHRGRCLLFREAR